MHEYVFDLKIMKQFPDKLETAIENLKMFHVKQKMRIILNGTGKLHIVFTSKG